MKKNAMNIPSVLIAPCGINCGVCRAYLREKNSCAGCNIDSRDKVKHCLVCHLRNCDQKPGVTSFCFECDQYPCKRLEQLDKRYRTKYGTSPIENLNRIKRSGIREFMKIENTRWVCEECGGAVCMHDQKCISCGKQYPNILRSN